MKKLLFVALIGTLVACGESTSETTTTDSTVAPVDTVAAPIVDSAIVVDSVPAVVDSTVAH